jgi:putative endonuclease
MERGGCVYIMTNFTRTTLYVGVTSDLLSRVQEHKGKKYKKSFSARYNLSFLIYYESFPSITEAIDREKSIKGKSRKWKEALIREVNISFRDLIDEINNW